MIHNDDWAIKSRVISEQFLGPVDHAMSRDGHIYFLTKNNNYSKNIFIYQEEGDLHPVHAQGQADLGQEEEEKETIVLVNFHFLHFYFLQCFVILIIFAHSCFCLMSGNTKAVLAINNMLQVV